MQDEEINSVNETNVSTHFEYGNLVLECGCSKSSVIAVAIKNGISLYLPTATNTYWSMRCDDCGNAFKLQFVESSEEEIIVAKEKEKDESVQQGDTEKQDDPGISDNIESNTTTDITTETSVGTDNQI